MFGTVHVTFPQFGSNLQLQVDREALKGAVYYVALTSC